MLYNKWWKNAGKCSGDEKQAEKKQSSLGVANVGGTFVILVAGLAMAAVVAVIEFVWYNTRTTHRDADHDHQVYSTDEDLCISAGARLNEAPRTTTNVLVVSSDVSSSPSPSIFWRLFLATFFYWSPYLQNNNRHLHAPKQNLPYGP